MFKFSTIRKTQNFNPEPLKFNVAAISLFDPDLAVIGTTAYFILDHFGRGLFIGFSLLYPIALGAASLILGYFIFRSKDLA